jgi:SagB-type dehydrogenase family enzyme
LIKYGDSVSYKINPFLFFLIKKGKIICWDYKNHQQFEIEKQYHQRLLDISKLNTISDFSDEIDSELYAANVLIESDQPQSHWGWDEMSKIFHVGTQDIPLAFSTEDYHEHVKYHLDFSERKKSNITHHEKDINIDTIALPEPNFSLLQGINFLDVLLKRRTTREFNNTQIPLEIFSLLLYLSFGVTEKKWDDLEELNILSPGFKKTSPSGGALHPSEAYLVVLNVESIKNGIYHYLSNSHRLELMTEINFSEKLGHLLCGQMFAKNLSLGIFITSNLSKCWEKYRHSRAYRIALFDIGHLSQTFLLSATSLGLNTWLTGAFLDTEIRTILKISEPSEYPMFFVGVGYGNQHSLDSEARKILKEKYDK